MTWTLITNPKEAIQEIQSWGDYPRTLDDGDAESLWLTDGQMYVWIEVARADQGAVGVIHMAAKPERRNKFYARPLLRAIDTLIQALDLEAIFACEGEGISLPDNVRNYVERLGWVKHPAGYARILG